jgi:hypothetical protein
MVAIAPNETAVVHSADHVQTPAVAAPERSTRRWSGRQTLAFVVVGSLAGWGAIGFAIFAALKR